MLKPVQRVVSVVRICEKISDEDFCAIEGRLGRALSTSRPFMHVHNDTVPLKNSDEKIFINSGFSFWR